MFVVGKSNSLVKNNGLIVYSICTLVNGSVLNTFIVSIRSVDVFLMLIQGELQKAKFDGLSFTFSSPQTLMIFKPKMSPMV